MPASPARRRHCRFHILSSRGQLLLLTEGSGGGASGAVEPLLLDANAPTRPFLFAKRLNLYVHAGRQVELHQRVHRLLRRFENIEQPLVRSDLKLLAGFLIHVRRTQHSVFVLHRGQWNRTRDLCAGAPRRINDFSGRLIKHFVVVSLQPDANSFFSYHSFCLKEPAGYCIPTVLFLFTRRGRPRPRDFCSAFRAHSADKNARATQSTNPESPKSCRRLPCGRLRESRTGVPFPSLPA